MLVMTTNKISSNSNYDINKQDASYTNSISYNAKG
jgi:hypothetical protein